MKYRKKPVVIEAVQFIDDPEEIIHLQNHMNEDQLKINYNNPNDPILEIETLEGTMSAKLGDYIIKGVQGEFYPCKPEIFESTYEKVE